MERESAHEEADGRARAPYSHRLDLLHGDRLDGAAGNVSHPEASGLQRVPRASLPPGFGASNRRSRQGLSGERERWGCVGGRGARGDRERVWGGRGIQYHTLSILRRQTHGSPRLLSALEENSPKEKEYRSLRMTSATSISEM